MIKRKVIVAIAFIIWIFRGSIAYPEMQVAWESVGSQIETGTYSYATNFSSDVRFVSARGVFHASSGVYADNSIYFALAVVNEGYWFTDGYIECDVKPESNYNDAGLIFRVKDIGAGEYYMANIYANASNGHDLRLTKGSTEVDFYSMTADYNNFHTIRVELNGANIKVYYDDVERIDYTDPSPILEGAVGITTNRGSGSGEFDNWDMSMDYIAMTESGMVGNDGALQSNTYSGENRQHASKYSGQQTGLVRYVFFDTGGSSGLSTTCNVGMHMMSDWEWGSTAHDIFAESSGGATDNSGIYEFDLGNEYLVIKGGRYSFSVATDDTTWTIDTVSESDSDYGIVRTSSNATTNPESATYGYYVKDGGEMRLWATNTLDGSY